MDEFGHSPSWSTCHEGSELGSCQDRPAQALHSPDSTIGTSPVRAKARSAHRVVRGRWAPGESLQGGEQGICRARFSLPWESETML